MYSAGPVTTTVRWRALGAPALTAGLLAGATTLLHFRDPHVSGSYGICPLYALTGYWCPGCGGLRAMHNLTEGHVLDAVHSNVLLLPLLLTFAVCWVAWTRRAWRGVSGGILPSFVGPRATWALLALVAGFTVLRNTPWGTWLAPV
ncbi:DUF2752 domain-containing protein [Nocardia stercoris]|uniref:DUF2752 domain-containing protein n=1 Tax=Nocardia stercoris TaxID=2483361 RepID=A0A3M2KXJ6_9NOCA|nr:DUF2752 domain-containing protein [Nocardia stercoris]